MGAKRIASLFSTALSVCVAGCMVGPDFQPPPAPSVTHYTSGADPKLTVPAQGIAQQFDLSARLPADWWQLFGSSTLNDAVKQGLSASPSIAAAEANLREAKDNLRSGQGVFYPQVNAGLGASRQRPSPNATPEKFQEGTFNLFTLSATVSYVLDIFGGERRTVEALGAVLDYQQNAARAAGLTLAANIANTLIALAAYQDEIDATNEIIALEKKQVQLAAVQTNAGTAAYAAQLSLESQLQSTEATLPQLQQKVVQAQDLLAALEGKLPANSQPPRIELDGLTLPHTVPVSVSSKLVSQRPDILQAQASLHAASAEIGVATAAMLPSVTLNGSFGYSDTSTGGLLSGASNLWSLGAGVAQPIFNGGTLWYRRQAARDAYDGAAAGYQQTVLSAFQQVADTLRALEHDAAELAIEDQAVATARRSLQIVQTNYATGLATYSDVLISDMQYRQALISDIEIKAMRYQDTVALFAALGGGWWNDHSNMASAQP